MIDGKVIYIHTGEWPSPSPSIVFVTGTAYGLAFHVPTELVVRNNTEEDTGTVFKALTGKDMPPNLDIVRIGQGGSTPGHGAFFRKAASHAGHLARRGEAGAVITRSVGFLPYLAYIRKRYGIPCFFETHDFFTDPVMRTDMARTLRTRRNALYEKLFFPRISGLICLTSCQEALFGKYYGNVPTTVAHTGCIRVEKPETSREKLICYVGSLDSHKGLGLVLSAIAGTVDREIGLLVIGGKTESEKREFMNYALRTGLENRVSITGWVQHADIGPMMDRCIAGIVPLSDTPYNRHITSPLKILDCLSRSLPVIGSDLPSVREYIEEGRHGLLFKPDNAVSLAECLDRFIEGNLFDAMRDEIERHAARFLYSERAKTILDFIVRAGNRS